jgi:hypothetical protein
LQSVKDLPMLAPLSMMIPGADQMLPMLPEPLGTLEKMSKMTLPILFIHAEADEIVPLAQATRAHAAAPSASKTFEKVGGGAGHNDLTARASQQYFGAVKRFLDSLTGGGLSADDVAGLSVKALKAELKQRGVAHEHCVEKAELRALLVEQLPASTPAAAGEEEPEPAPQVAPPGAASGGAAAEGGGADGMGEQEVD